MDMLVIVSTCDTRSFFDSTNAISMAGGMLILLAASKIPSLRSRIGGEVTNLGDHLQQLFETWMFVPSDSVSPSVEQSLRMICDVGAFLKSEYLRGVHGD